MAISILYIVCVPWHVHGHLPSPTCAASPWPQPAQRLAPPSTCTAAAAVTHTVCRLATVNLHCSAPPARHVQHNCPSNNSEILIKKAGKVAHQHAAFSFQSAPPVTPDTLTRSVTNWCRRLRCACAPTTVQGENWRYTLHHLAIVLRGWRRSCVNQG